MPSSPVEGLRERKKRQTRQQISDVATRLFLERGFDAVRVAEVAAECGVSEKTVYNYFPTKESLLFDREEAMAADITRALGPGAERISPVESAVRVLNETARATYDYVAASPPGEMNVLLRFHELVEGTPSLRAAQQDMMERLSRVAAEALAARAGVDVEDPEPQVAASALLGLWRVQFQSMRRQAAAGVTAEEAHERVVADVRRAARLIDTGLWSFVLNAPGPAARKDVKAAVDAASEARRQAKEAIRHARSAWRQVMTEAHREAHQGHARGQEEREKAMRERQRLHQERQRMVQEAKQAARERAAGARERRDRP